MARRTWKRAPRLITELVAGPAKLSMWSTFNASLIEDNQFEIRLAVHGTILDTWVVIGRYAALRKFEELKPEMAVTVARIALGL